MFEGELSIAQRGGFAVHADFAHQRFRFVPAVFHLGKGQREFGPFAASGGGDAGF